MNLLDFKWIRALSTIPDLEMSVSLARQEI